MSEKVKHGSGLDPEDDPSWYRILNPLFSETNEDIVLTSENADLSFKGDFRNYESPSSDEESDHQTSEDDENSDQSENEIQRKEDKENEDGEASGVKSSTKKRRGSRKNRSLTSQGING